jgi:D-3-phosphoglycerate dehydrogenase / 2-oxoglutarate reductase
MSLKRVLMVDSIHQKGIEVFNNSGFEVWSLPSKDQTAIIEALGKGVEAVVVRTSKINSAIIDAAPGLKIIGRHGSGLDNIDVAHASKKKIAVINTPHANTMSVVEYVIGAVFWFAKGFLYCDEQVKKGEWSFRESYQPLELQGKQIGVVGYGLIGREVVRLMAALGLKVLVYDPYLDPAQKLPDNVLESDDLDELLKTSDFVTLHVPLTEQTRNLINLSKLRLMKKGAYLINGARGEVAPEKDLFTALSEGIISGAAVDVFEQEPPDRNNPLFGLKNVLLTPHNASLTEAAKIKAATTVAREIVAYLNGETPEFLVNREILPGRS